MSSVEKRRTVAKIVLVFSTTLLVLLLLTQFTDLFSPSSTTTETSSTTDLKSIYDQLKQKYDENTEKIKTAQIKTDELNSSISELNSYADKKTPRYAIGAGISIIVGLWIATIILYIKVSRDLFKE